MDRGVILQLEESLAKNKEHLTERDRFLHKFLGRCYHEFYEHNEWDGIERNYFNVCKYCGLPESVLKYNNMLNLDFSRWETFGILLEFIKENAKLGNNFHNKYWLFLYGSFSPIANGLGFYWAALNPTQFADTVYWYFKMEEDSQEVT